MAPDDTNRDGTDTFTAKYSPGRERTLSETVLDAIESYKDEDLTISECKLYDDINPDGLNITFQEDAQSNAVVAFDADDVRETLQQGNGDITIRVTSVDSERTPPM